MNLPVVAATANSAKKATVSKSVKTTARIAFVIDGPSPANDYFLENFKKSITASVAKDYNAVYPKELVYTAEDGTQTKELIHEFDGPGIIQGMHNINASIESFESASFKRNNRCRIGLFDIKIHSKS